MCLGRKVSEQKETKTLSRWGTIANPNAKVFDYQPPWGMTQATE